MATKTKQSKPADSRVFDTHAQMVLSRFIYAAQKDIEANWNGDAKYSPNVYQSYDNMLKTKEDQGNSLKGRFSISDAAKQFITFFFGRMIAEIKNIDLNDNDTVETMRGKLVDANVECYSDFMFGLAATLRGDFGETLNSAGDPAQWYRSQICGLLPKYQMNERVISLISVEFNDFLKAVSWILGTLLWYHPKAIDEGMFIGSVVALQGMRQEMIDVLSACLREKPPVKPKVAKPKVAKAADSTEVKGESTDNNNSAEVKVTDDETTEHTESPILSDVDAAALEVMNLV